VCLYLTLVKNLPVLGVGEADYKTEEACLNAMRVRKTRSGASRVTG
jgi:hypothetical protein